jgi:hypothetical protein
MPDNKKTVRVYPHSTLPSIKEEVLTPKILKENYFSEPVRKSIQREHGALDLLAKKKGGKTRKRNGRKKSHRRR